MRVFEELAHRWNLDAQDLDKEAERQEYYRQRSNSYPAVRCHQEGAATARSAASHIRKCMNDLLNAIRENQKKRDEDKQGVDDGEN